MEYFFENEQLRNIKITKTIKYWPDHILDQLLRVTVANYDISYGADILRAGQTYSSENQNESKLIYIGYDDSLKPEYAYVELSSKHNL